MRLTLKTTKYAMIRNIAMYHSAKGNKEDGLRLRRRLRVYAFPVLVHQCQDAKV